MADMLIAPPTAGSWRVDIAQFESWLRARWPEIARLPGSGQQAHHWSWPDRCEVWVPEHRKCVWLAAEPTKISAIGAWFGSIATDPLILCDEGFSNDVTIQGATEADLAERLANWG